MPSDTQVAKWGNSLAIRIPRAIVKEARLTEGDRLLLDLTGDGSIILRPTHRKYTLAELVAGIKPGNRHAETDWGPSQGREFW
jgi:antitoxin MazE